MPTAVVNHDDLEQARVTRRAVEILSSGGLVVFPTETVYGVAASLKRGGYEALHALKGQAPGTPEKAFTVHIPDPAAAERYVDASNPPLRRFMKKVFPGPVTLVIDVTEEVIQSRLKHLNLPASARGRLYDGQTISLRCPDHPLAQQILGSLDGPIVASSANRQGAPPPLEASDISAEVAARVGLVIDGGKCRYSKPSTIVRVTGAGASQRFTVERVGVYDERFIQKLMRWTMLVVCSGNTCRSPMAEGLARQLLAEQRGVSVDDLDNLGLRVMSAGVFAAPGMPASGEAVESMKRIGVDLSRHRSRPLTQEMIHESDVIYCMTKAHRGAVLRMSPGAEEKTLLLDAGGDIEDPIGTDLTAYQRCAELIRRRLAQRLKEQQP